MNSREKIISDIEKAKKQSKEYAQDRIIVPFKEADMIITLLKEQPEIVRCKDCKHSKDKYGGMFCPKFGFVHQENWFCADGDRR